MGRKSDSPSDSVCTPDGVLFRIFNYSIGGKLPFEFVLLMLSPEEFVNFLYCFRQCKDSYPVVGLYMRITDGDKGFVASDYSAHDSISREVHILEWSFSDFCVWGNNKFKDFSICSAHIFYEPDFVA